jgi:hypothetical protein
MNAKHCATWAGRSAPTSDNAPWQARVIEGQTDRDRRDFAIVGCERQGLLISTEGPSLRDVGDLLRSIGRERP